MTLRIFAPGVLVQTCMLEESVHDAWFVIAVQLQ